MTLYLTFRRQENRRNGGFYDGDNVYGRVERSRPNETASRFRERACRTSAIPFYSWETLKIPYAHMKFIPKGREERSSERRGVRWPSSVINSRTIALKRESIKDYLSLSFRPTVSSFSSLSQETRCSCLLSRSIERS